MEPKQHPSRNERRSFSVAGHTVEEIEDGWRISDEGGGCHMANWHELAFIGEILRLRSATSERVTPWMPTPEQPLFNELALRDEVAKMWGANGAHSEVLRMLLRDEQRYRWLTEQAQEGDWGHHYGWKLHLDIKGAPSLETLDQAIDAMRGVAHRQGEANAD